MTSEKDGGRTYRCIRCDEPTAEEYPSHGDYQQLTFDHEAGALPICSECFGEVRDRDMWR